MGNGVANIIAALLVSGALVWNGLGGKNDANALSDEQIASIYDRAIGDIRNDIVINCGCCGEEEGARRETRSF
ncbi:MAG: hypothetical protein AAF850_03845 [Pseudomonadota bacterium]